MEIEINNIIFLVFVCPHPILEFNILLLVIFTYLNATKKIKTKYNPTIDAYLIVSSELPAKDSPIIKVKIEGIEKYKILKNNKYEK